MSTRWYGVAEALAVVVVVVPLPLSCPFAAARMRRNTWTLTSFLACSTRVASLMCALPGKVCKASMTFIRNVMKSSWNAFAIEAGSERHVCERSRSDAEWDLHSGESSKRPSIEETWQETCTEEKSLERLEGQAVVVVVAVAVAVAAAAVQAMRG